jgi:hypothetical protein
LFQDAISKEYCIFALNLIKDIYEKGINSFPLDITHARYIIKCRSVYRYMERMDWLHASDRGFAKSYQPFRHSGVFS